MSHFYFGWAVGVKSKQNPTGTARPMVPPLNLTIFESGYGEGRCQYRQKGLFDFTVIDYLWECEFWPCAEKFILMTDIHFVEAKKDS